MILVDHKGVGGSGEDSAGASEWFSTSANTGQVLGLREGLVIDQVG